VIKNILANNFFVKKLIDITMRNLFYHFLVLGRLLLFGYMVLLIVFSLLKGEFVFFSKNFIPAATVLFAMFLVNLFSYFRFFHVRPKLQEEAKLLSDKTLDQITLILKNNFNVNQVKRDGNFISFRTKPGMTWGENISIEKIENSTQDNFIYKVKSKTPYILVDFGKNYLNIQRIKNILSN